MHWEILIIPLIAVGVWVLGTVFRDQRDNQQFPVHDRPLS